jgi:hypothetical protein
MGKTMMTILLTCGLGHGWAQTSPAPASKNKASPTKSRVAQKSPAKPSPKVVQEQVLLPALTDDLLEVASQVHTGTVVCEASTVKISPLPSAPQGYFDLHMGKHHYRMAPVASLTGAVRLEDTVHGAVWIQLANKSMLMNQKVGRRMADECQSPAQMVVAEAMAKMPPINILEPLGDVRPVPAAELANK